MNLWIKIKTHKGLSIPLGIGVILGIAGLIFRHEIGEAYWLVASAKFGTIFSITIAEWLSKTLHYNITLEDFHSMLITAVATLAGLGWYSFFYMWRRKRILEKSK